MNVLAHINIHLSNDGYWRWSVRLGGKTYRCRLKYRDGEWAKWDALHHLERGWLDDCEYIRKR